jgi:hypothetical protein
MKQGQNYHVCRYGTVDGEVQFGHIHEDGVICAVMLRSGYDENHYMMMDADGHREGHTMHRVPGVFSVKAGENVTDGDPAVVIDALRGDIILSAQKGKIQLQAKNIFLSAQGEDNKNGYVTIEANEKFDVRAKNIELNASSVAKFFSSGTLETVGKGLLNIYGGLMQTADGASMIGGSKSCPASTPQSVPNPLYPFEIQENLFDLLGF